MVMNDVAFHSIFYKHLPEEIDISVTILLKIHLHISVPKWQHKTWLFKVISKTECSIYSVFPHTFYVPFSSFLELNKRVNVWYRSWTYAGERSLLTPCSKICEKFPEHLEETLKFSFSPPGNPRQRLIWAPIFSSAATPKRLGPSLSNTTRYGKPNVIISSYYGIFLIRLMYIVVHKRC